MTDTREKTQQDRDEKPDEQGPVPAVEFGGPQTGEPPYYQCDCGEKIALRPVAAVEAAKSNHVRQEHEPGRSWRTADFFDLVTEGDGS